MAKPSAFPTRRWLAIGLGVGTLALVTVGALLAGPTGGRVVRAGASACSSSPAAPILLQAARLTAASVTRWRNALAASPRDQVLSGTRPMGSLMGWPRSAAPCPSS